MLENAIYSVISPEGCATILWRDPQRMLDAAKAMKLCARDLLELEIIDEIIPEPIGGAHRDRELILQNVRDSISKNLNIYNNMTSQEIFENRKNKFLRIGRNKGFISNLDEISSLKPQVQNFNQVLKSKKIIVLVAVIVTLIISSLFIFL